MASWMLELDPTGWQLVARRESQCADVAAGQFAADELLLQAEPIQAALAADGYRGEPVVVALQSSWCLAATMPIDRPQTLRDRQTMAYRLEEWIPWGAEEFVADFLGGRATALAVAVEWEPLAAFLAKLEEAGVAISAIIPLALLAVAQHIKTDEAPIGHVLLLDHDSAIDLVVIDDRRPVKWLWLPSSGPLLGRELRQLALETGKPAEVVAYGLDEAQVDELEQDEAVANVTAHDALPRVIAAAAAEEIAEGRSEPLVDLKRGPFGQRRQNTALRRYRVVLQAAAAVLLLVTASMLYYRGQTAERMADTAAARQADVFHEVFPTSKVPVGVRSRLESELAKLQGLQGSDTALPESVSAIRILHRLLSSLPTDRRFRLLEIRIEEGRLYLDGEVRSHSDAEALAQRLRAAELDVTSPRTQRLDGKRVSLRITGSLAVAGQAKERIVR